MEQGRPNPEELLKAVQHEEESVKKGRLKVFLGMAAGVGKTYAMLEDAHKLQDDGVDVVVGIVNTHGRVETESLLIGLSEVPPKVIEYRGASFQELNLEAVLERKPDCVLVDEFAHTNIPGSRHLKRWQDVVEILDNGIDVATTINVQHIESLKDVIETITGVVIHETVPDSVLEGATFIEVIDLTPTELLQRLHEGKVYLGTQAKIAIAHFFQEDRLTALREIALRFAATKVDHDLRGMVSTIGRMGIWRPRERLLVAISHSPHSKTLIRATRRLAFTLDAPWIAVHVDNGKELEEQEACSLSQNLELARELGAEIITTQESDIVSGIERIARQKAVTQIILGRPPPARFFGFERRFHLLDHLATECSDIDLHVIRQMPQADATKRKKIRLTFGAITSYLYVIASIVLMTVISSFLVSYIGYKVVGFIFLLGILFLSLVFKKGPVILASILYGLIWDYFFIPPVKTFIISSDEDVFLLVLYVLTAVSTGILSDRERTQKEMLTKREETAEALYEIVREIASNPSSQKIVGSVTSRLSLILKGSCEVLLKPPGSQLQLDAANAYDAKEKATAKWVFENVKEAGWSTSTLPMSQHLFIPLKGRNLTVGVLAFRPTSNQPLTTEEKNFLYTAGQQLAYYLERSYLEEQKE